MDVQDVVRASRDECPNGLRIRRPDDGHARLLERGSGGGDEHLLEVRQVALDVATVGADQPLRVDDGIVDPKTNPFSDERLGELHVWTLAKVIRLGLEAQSEERYFTRFCVEDAANGQAEVRLVASQDPSEHGNVDVVDTGEVHECAHVLRQARAAEREPRTKIRSGDVEALVLTEDLHHVAGVDADGTEEPTDLVRERDLQRMVGIARVLQRLGLVDRERVRRPLEAGEKIGDDPERPIIADAGNDERRLEEVRDPGPSRRNSGAIATPKSSSARRELSALEHGSDLTVNRARWDGASVDDCDELLGARRVLDRSRRSRARHARDSLFRHFGPVCRRRP